MLRRKRKIYIYNNIMSHIYRRKKCIREIVRDVIGRTVAIVISHPLEVISLRMMAQFVGGETKYRYCVL